MQLLKNPHVGDHLQDYLKDYGWTPYRLAKRLGVPQTRIEAILDGKRGISVDTAFRLGRLFHQSPEYWLGLQRFYDVETFRRDPERMCALDAIEPVPLPEGPIPDGE